MKKRMGILLSIAFLWCFALPVSAQGNTGEGLGSYFKVNDHSPYVSGYGDNKFGPNKSITRAEVTQMLYNLLRQPVNNTQTHFTDVPLDRWYRQAVNALAQIDVFRGYGDGTFCSDWRKRWDFHSESSCYCPHKFHSA